MYHLMPGKSHDFLLKKSHGIFIKKLDIVCFDFSVKRRKINPQQFGCVRFTSTALLQCLYNQLSLRFFEAKRFCPFKLINVPNQIRRSFPQIAFFQCVHI